MKIRLISCLVFALAFLFLPQGGARALQSEININLITSKPLPGSFPTNQSLTLDKDRIYLASFQGVLFVLQNNLSKNFPTLAEIKVSNAALTSVQVDNNYIYITSADGKFYVYEKKSLQFEQAVTLANFNLSSSSVNPNSLYVALGQTTVAQNGNKLFLSQLNSGEVVQRLNKKDLGVDSIFGENFEDGVTVVYDTRTGERLGSIPNPVNVFGHINHPALYLSTKVLIQTVPGCCGTGIYVYDAKTLNKLQTINRLYTNDVVVSGDYLIGGTEAGTIDIFDFKQNPGPMLASINLPQVTGHMNPEDIEIRALAVHDNLIFAASSWGNENSRGPELPSFFVLQINDNQNNNSAPIRLAEASQNLEQMAQVSDITMTAPAWFTGLALVRSVQLEGGLNEILADLRKRPSIKETKEEK